MPKILSIEDKLLKNLPAAELAGRMMALPTTQRMSILLDRADSEAVVAALPEPDFYYFIKELDPESALPLLAMSRHEQFTHLIDVDCWQADELKAAKTLAWCEAMIAANEVKFIQWLYKVDFEFLIILFKKWLDRVEIIEDEDDYQEESDILPRLTVDNQYYFSTRYPTHESLLKYVLGYLFENHHGFYIALLQHTRNGMEADINELAYRFHQGRLADHAIPNAEEAATIYQPLPSHKIKRDKTILPFSEDDGAAPSFALAIIRHRDLLGAAIGRITDPAAQATLRLELTSLANKVLIADAMDPDEPETLRRAADKAAAMVNLGLDLLSGNDENSAAETLQNVYLENIFRLGQTEIAALINRLNHTIDNDIAPFWPEGLNLLDEPWLEYIDLLSAKTPIIMRPQSDGPTEEDFIRSSADLARANEIAGIIEALPPLLHACKQSCQVDWEQLGAGLYRKGQIHDLGDVTLGAMLLTGVANEIWTGGFEISPLPLSMWAKIAPLLAPQAVENTLSARLSEITTDSTRAAVYMRPILDRYHQEMAHRTELPEAGMMPFFLFTETDA